MKAAFWHDRWKNNQIDFHNEEFNQQGHPVVGVDLFGSSFDVETLWSSDWVDAPPGFRERGMETRRDTVVRLDRGGRA